MNASSRTTQVSLVAAGPGDPGLLTVCAVGLLHDADVVVTDPECEPIARAHARIDAQILVAVDDDGNVADHADRVQLVIDPALEGRRVVRLMAGDPVLDGSLALEAGGPGPGGYRLRHRPRGVHGHRIGGLRRLLADRRPCA